MADELRLLTKGINGGPSDGQSRLPALSADGLFVAFVSEATNLVAGDTNGVQDVYLADRLLGTIERVSIAASGGQGNGPSGGSKAPAISADGRFLAFASEASNLVAGDGNGARDVFVLDRTAGTLERIAVPTIAGVTGVAGDPALSADGRFLAFLGSLAGPAGSAPESALFLLDRTSGSIERVEVDNAALGLDLVAAGAGDPALSADGRFIVFGAGLDVIGPPVVSNDDLEGPANTRVGVLLHDRVSGTTEFLDTGVNLTAAGQGSLVDTRPAISGNGDRVAFAFENGRPSIRDFPVFDSPSLHVVDWESGVDLAEFGDLQFLNAPAFDASGRLLALGFSNASPRFPPSPEAVLVDLDAGTTLASVGGFVATVLDPGLSADGRVLAVPFSPGSSGRPNELPDDGNGFVDIYTLTLAASPLFEIGGLGPARLVVPLELPNYSFNSARPFPILEEGVRLPDAPPISTGGVVNDVGLLVRREREISIEVLDSVAVLDNAIGVYRWFTNTDGGPMLTVLREPEIIIPSVKDAIGQTISLGEFEGDLGFFLVAGGGDLDLAGRELRFVDDAGRPAQFVTSNPTLLVDGVPIAAPVFHAPSGAFSGGDHAFRNPDGLVHAVSGLEPGLGDGLVRIGFEDLLGSAPSDFDYNDAVLGVRFGPAPTQTIVIPSVAPQLTVGDGELDSATVRIAEARADERLTLGLPDADADGIIDGTSIAYEFSRVHGPWSVALRLEGVDSAANYQKVLRSIGYEATAQPSLSSFIDQAGVIEPRVVEYKLTEPLGAATTAGLTIEFPLAATPALTGTAGDDLLDLGALTTPVNAALGLAGDDEIRDGAGDDLLAGGPGADLLVTTTGRNQLVGGDGADQLVLGPGQDRIVVLGLGERSDIVRSFDATTDRIDLIALELIPSRDPTLPLADYVRLEAADLGGGGGLDDVLVSVDLDGATSALTTPVPILALREAVGFTSLEALLATVVIS